jgi:hypothetical protein
MPVSTLLAGYRKALAEAFALNGRSHVGETPSSLVRKIFAPMPMTVK